MNGKVAVITGGTRGIGLAIAAWMLEHGASVVVSGRDADRLNLALKELTQDGAPAAGLVADVARREDAERVVELARERFGRLDVLVNNAGITRDGLILRMKDDDWDRVLETNLKGAFLMTRAASKAMVRANRRRHGQCRPGELLRGQSRTHRADQSHRTRTRALGHSGERRRAGIDRDGHGGRIARRRARRAAGAGPAQAHRNGP
jgi:NAD(P)-dependent dehydrogenase (short-subunit alcohol dehydrogenase family)